MSFTKYLNNKEKYKMISKDTFVKAINQIITVYEYYNKLNELFDEYGADGYIYPPTCADALVLVLEEAMGLEHNESNYNDISYFVYELYCGKDWKPGMATEIVNGQEVDIDMSTPEKLYDYLVNKDKNLKSKVGEITE